MSSFNCCSSNPSTSFMYLIPSVSAVFVWRNIFCCCLVRKRPRKPSLEESSYSEISSSSSSDSEELSAEGNIPHLSPTRSTSRKIVDSDSEEESDDSDIYEQFRTVQKLSVNSVYSNEESSEEEELQRKNVIEKSISPIPAVHMDHDYAKPAIASDAEDNSLKEEDGNVQVDAN